jgi:hypothetical protein
MTSWVEAVGQVTEREVVIGDGVERHVETVVVGREVVREVDPGDRIPRLFQTARDDDRGSGRADGRGVPGAQWRRGRGHLDLRGARDLIASSTGCGVRHIRRGRRVVDMGPSEERTGMSA